MQKKIDDLEKEASNNRLAASILGGMIERGDAVQAADGSIKIASSPSKRK